MITFQKKYMNSFIALFNKSGIACASDTDNTIYRISREEPVAFAVCTDSPIPWNNIIAQYCRKGEPTHHNTIEEYARDFETFIQTLPADTAWNKFGIDELNLMVFGYGVEDIYPSVCDIQIVVDEVAGRMKFGSVSVDKISISNDAHLGIIGDWSCLEPIMSGATVHVQNYAVAKQLELYEKYKDRVMEKFKGTKYEEYVRESFENFDYKNSLPCIVDNVIQKELRDVYVGIDSFSVEDIVTSAETLVNSNVRLLHLKAGGKGLTGSTREIAVLTRAEGFTWIKHSLYAI